MDRRAEPVTAAEVAREIGGILSGEPSTVITDITHDSRRITQGALFVAIQGATTDAHRFIPEVLKRGAAGVISQQPVAPGFEAVWIRVAEARAAMALAAAAVYRHPSRCLNLVGITGTNGKTTIAYLISAISEAAGEPVAMTSTV